MHFATAFQPAQLACSHQRQRLRAKRRPPRCGPVIKDSWNGEDPVPAELPNTSVKLQRPSGSIDGMTLFQLCQSRPYLRELRVSAASFTSPMPGQWNLRNLQKLHVDFSQASIDDDTIDQFLQFGDRLYLKELKLTYTGPGFASLQAASLDRLHVESLQLRGFDIRRAALLAKRKARLVDCVLDISKLDMNLFYKSAPDLVLERCRLAQKLSWRTYLAAAGLSAVAIVSLTDSGAGPLAGLTFLLVLLSAFTWFLSK